MGTELIRAMIERKRRQAAKVAEELEQLVQLLKSVEGAAALSPRK